MTRHILIIDLDVHQGDGTAKIFSNDNRVMTVSLHAAKNFPSDKANSDLDVALKDKCTDAGYLETLDQTLDHLTRICEPDLVFYNAGVDVHHEDRLGRLSLTANGIRARDRRVLEWCRSLQVPVTCVMGGGYQSDTRALAGLHAIVFEEAADLFGYTKAAGG
jgi:acetoin utilization deacetylase AcuC-like enzyme